MKLQEKVKEQMGSNCKKHHGENEIKFQERVMGKLDENARENHVEMG